MAKISKEISISTVQNINRSDGTFSVMSGITITDKEGIHNFYLGVYGNLKNGYVNLNDCGTMYCLYRSRGHIMALLDLLGHTSYRAIKSKTMVDEFETFFEDFVHYF